jgi:prepilin-type N-terminal cleavage/methylation domain-containing protein
MKPRCNAAFTLVEVLIVVVIMAILAAVIVPNFVDTQTDARESSALFNLHTLRSQIQVYRAEHAGKLPGPLLEELTKATDRDGNASAGGPCGPYCAQIPVNPFSNSAAVKTTANSPAQEADVSSSHGWIYNPTTGQIWISHVDYYGK